MESDKSVCSKNTSQSENKSVHSSAKQVIGSDMMVEIDPDTDHQAPKATNSNAMSVDSNGTEGEAQESSESDVIEDANCGGVEEVNEGAQQQSVETEEVVALPSTSASVAGGAEVLLSNKGKHHVTFFKGYKYERHSTRNGIEYNRCATYRVTGCKAKLNKKVGETDPSKFILKGIHHHTGDARKVGKANAMKKLKEDAKNSRNTSRQVVTNAINGLNKSTMATIASEKSLVKMVSRLRHNQNHPKNPRSVEELNLPDEYRRTIKGDNFLLYDSSSDYGDDNRFLIFGTIDNLKFLSRCDSIYMDGTFSVVPVIFSQLYTIHGRLSGFHVPLIHVLTSDKSEETYNSIFRAILELEPNLNPTDVMTDFEMATINAVRTHFPLAERHGCLFHFSQSVWRHIQSVGLQSVYNENAEFAFQLRLLIALAFLPSGSIVDAYKELVSTEFFDGENEHKEAIEELLTYFQQTYVYALDRRGQEKPPLFPPEFWSVYSLVLLGFPKTNNHCEGYHNRMATIWGVHPNIFTFINGLKQEQEIQELEMARIEAGNEAAARKATYVKSDKRLIEIVKKFDSEIHDGSYLPYLHQIAHNARY